MANTLQLHKRLAALAAKIEDRQEELAEFKSALKEFKARLAEHSALGSANTQLGVQRQRPSLYDLVGEMQRLEVPTLILTGDEDWPCLTPGLLMKRNIATAALVVMANCGHAINLDAPDEFNRIVREFITQVDAGRWPVRDPRAISGSVTGMTPP